MFEGGEMTTTEIMVYSILWTVLLLSSLIFGKLLKLYDKTKWFDLLLHLYSGILIVLTSVTILTDWLKLKLWITVMFAFIITMAVSVLWELYEFLSDRIFHTNAQRWKDGPGAGLRDSMTDLISAAIGAIITCVILMII